ncbi:MAG: GNAT family N-acetyltransferase [Chloroflexi bacterium]|nr:GNAT family N-acetyltransferase [Chloroflexota bacterium]
MRVPLPGKTKGMLLPLPAAQRLGPSIASPASSPASLRAAPSTAARTPTPTARSAAPVPDAVEGTRNRVVGVAQRRLPRPMPKPRVRQEIVIRPAGEADAAGCLAVNTSYTSSHIWQLDTRHEGDELRIAFRVVRLPRELTQIAGHGLPPLRNGVPRRGVLWLVAEEVELRDEPELTDAGHGDAPTGAAGAGYRDGRWLAQPAATTSMAWNHTVRRSGGASAIQLGLPSQPAHAAHPGYPAQTGGTDGSPNTMGSSLAGGVREADLDQHTAPADAPAGRIIGYVTVATARGDETAYLRALIVDQAYRRRGIGGRLLAEARRWAAGQGAVRLTTDVAARNYPALRLLQKAGFTFCGYNDRCYTNYEVALFFSAPLR